MNLDWMDKALCRDEDPELFFPSSVGVAAQHQAEQAARVCAECPVQLECAEQRNRSGASSGVWGGSYHRTHPPRQRAPINHGTTTGYRNGCRCDVCRSGHMFANRKWPRR